MINLITTDKLVDSRQEGWIRYREGDAWISVKVVRSKSGNLFLSHVTGYKPGLIVETVEYEDQVLWNEKAKYMLEEFKKVAWGKK